MDDSELLGHCHSEIKFWTEHLKCTKEKIDRINEEFQIFAKKKYQKQSDIDMLLAKSNDAQDEFQNVRHMLKELRQCIKDIENDVIVQLHNYNCFFSLLLLCFVMSCFVFQGHNKKT